MNQRILRYHVFECYLNFVRNVCSATYNKMHVMKVEKNQNTKIDDERQIM